MEVDCTSEENLNKMIDLLELDKSKMRFGAFDVTYEEYYGIDTDVINNKTPSITFSGIMDEIKPTKNMELLEQIYKSYDFSKKNGGAKKLKKSSKKRSKKSSQKKLSKKKSKKRVK
jgi:hypothetical protein